MGAWLCAGAIWWAEGTTPPDAAGSSVRLRLDGVNPFRPPLYESMQKRGQIPLTGIKIFFFF